jgi:hypothetical protein
MLAVSRAWALGRAARSTLESEMVFLWERLSSREGDRGGTPLPQKNIHPAGSELGTRPSGAPLRNRSKFKSRACGELWERHPAAMR